MLHIDGLCVRSSTSMVLSVKERFGGPIEYVMGNGELEDFFHAYDAFDCRIEDFRAAQDLIEKDLCPVAEVLNELKPSKYPPRR